jgi:hypothetical protein
MMNLSNAEHLIGFAIPQALFFLFFAAKPGSES